MSIENKKVYEKFILDYVASKAAQSSLQNVKKKNLDYIFIPVTQMNKL